MQIDDIEFQWVITPTQDEIDRVFALRNNHTIKQPALEKKDGTSFIQDISTLVGHDVDEIVSCDMLMRERGNMTINRGMLSDIGMMVETILCGHYIFYLAVNFIESDDGTPLYKVCVSPYFSPDDQKKFTDKEGYTSQYKIINTECYKRLVYYLSETYYNVRMDEKKRG